MNIEQGILTYVTEKDLSPDGVLTVPKGVRTITGSTFDYDRVRSKMTGVILPEGVKRLDWDAFFSIDKLKEITLPSSIEYIGKECFKDCVHLKKVTFAQSSNLYIDAFAFWSTNIEELNLPNSCEISYRSLEGVKLETLRIGPLSLEDDDLRKYLNECMPSLKSINGRAVSHLSKGEWARCVDGLVWTDSLASARHPLGREVDWYSRAKRIDGTDVIVLCDRNEEGNECYRVCPADDIEEIAKSIASLAEQTNRFRAIATDIISECQSQELTGREVCTEAGCRSDIETYTKPEFNNDQMTQIRLGLESGVNVSIYAKPEFNSAQMAQIRLGLEKGLDVSIYARPEFDSCQMQEIRFGLEDDLDVSIYAKPEFGWAQMGEIREGLESGVDVSIYAKPEFDWAQMGEIRLGLARTFIEYER